MEGLSVISSIAALSDQSLVPDGTYQRVEIGLNGESPQPICIADTAAGTRHVRVAVEAHIIGSHQPRWRDDYAGRVIRCALTSFRHGKDSTVQQLLRALGDTEDVNVDDVREVRSRLVPLLSNRPTVQIITRCEAISPRRGRVVVKGWRNLPLDVYGKPMSVFLFGNEVLTVSVQIRKIEPIAGNRFQTSNEFRIPRLENHAL